MGMRDGFMKDLTRRGDQLTGGVDDPQE